MDSDKDDWQPQPEGENGPPKKQSRHYTYSEMSGIEMSESDGTADPGVDDISDVGRYSGHFAALDSRIAGNSGVGQCSTLHDTKSFKQASSQHLPAVSDVGQCSTLHDTKSFKQTCSQHLPAASDVGQCSTLNDAKSFKQTCSQHLPAASDVGQCSTLHNTKSFKQACSQHLPAASSSRENIHFGQTSDETESLVVDHLNQPGNFFVRGTSSHHQQAINQMATYSSNSDSSNKHKLCSDNANRSKSAGVFETGVALEIKKLETNSGHDDKKVYEKSEVVETSSSFERPCSSTTNKQSHETCEEGEASSSHGSFERGSSSTAYKSGGCDCSSELVATMVIQRHHTEAYCSICSPNCDLQPFKGVSNSTCGCGTINKRSLDEADVSMVKTLETSVKGAEDTCDCHSDVCSPGGSKANETSTLQFNDLPVPIILKIFGYLSLYEQLHKVVLVCKFWNYLCQDPELWRVLDLRGQFKLTNSILVRLTSYSEHVTSIDLSDSKLISSDGIEALTRRCHALRVLKLSRCYSLMSRAFRSIGQNCPRLQKLFFDICYSLTDTDLQCIAEGCPRLTHVSLNHCDAITDVGVRALAFHCRQLESINLDHLGKLTHLSLESLSENCSNLSTVSLMSAVMNDEGILHLTKLSNLRVLDVSNITALTQRSVTCIVLKCKQLIKLNVCLMRWVDDAMIEMIARNAVNLRTLHCVSCNISDQGLRILADNAKNMEILDVSWCNDITAEGVEYIAQRCRTLRFISLIRCDRVTMETLSEFVERYPWIHFSSFFLDAQRLLQQAIKKGYV